MRNFSGKINFYKHMDFDKNTFRFLMWYQRLKHKMLKDASTNYENGKTYKTEK